jgi:hypothetical protein
VQDVLRQAGQARELCRLIQITGQRNDPMRAQQVVALRRMRQGVQAIAPAQELDHAQSDIPTPDDK